MGLPERPTDAPQNQEANKCVHPARRPRTRMCLLKGCEQPFHPQQASERYCSARCCEKAREWSAWKAQQKYRTTLRGKEKRTAQSRRYRERVRGRKEANAGEAADEAARVISPGIFLILPATGQVATNSSCVPLDPRGRDSVRSSAGVRWSAFWSGNDAGESCAESKSYATSVKYRSIWGGCESFRGSSGHIDAGREISVGSAGPQEEEGTRGAVVGSFVPSSSIRFSGRVLVLRWAPESLLDLPCAEIGEHYGRYRLHQPEAERAMARSLERYGQLSPVVVCRREGRYELIDGFKRLGAARTLASISHLSVRAMEADDRTAKAAIYGLNRAGGRTRELEEAWIVQALVREDGLSQVEVAELLGRHKSWVCRRLALIERLGPESRDELRAGLLSPSAARQIVRLPPGNQAEVLALIRREALSSTELTRVVDLLLECPGQSQQDYILGKPREALSQLKGGVLSARDPRLSEAGNQVWKRVGMLLDLLGRMEVWLAHQGRTGLTPGDRAILSPRFQRLAQDAGSVAALSRDLISELENP